jgi:molecular chaperone DnaK (HSP70)
MSGDERSHLEVILEDINGKFDLVLEGHVTLEHMIHEQRAEAQQDKRELQALIQTSHDSLDAKINKVSTELKEEIQGVRTELKEEIRAVDKRLTSEIRAVGTKVEGHEDRIRFLERKAA